ncbi:MAG: hypothetical protein J0I06_03350 [Planctomycetes bacterium]|nr:hypothetical protein [Planctomycetota bacterium]
MEFNLRRVAEYIRGADTEELLDRVTVYREGMEPAALDLMEGELDRRGITREEIAAHDARHRAAAIILPDGTAMRCNFCSRPAVVRALRWHRVFGLVPVFPTRFAYCAFHADQKRVKWNDPNADANPSSDEGS